jgi:hypothetical protein
MIITSRLLFIRYTGIGEGTQIHFLWQVPAQVNVVFYCQYHSPTCGLQGLTEKSATGKVFLKA